MDREAWCAIVHRVSKSQTRLKRLSMHTLSVTKNLVMDDHSHSGQSSWVLNAIPSVFIRESRGRLHTHTQRRNPIWSQMQRQEWCGHSQELPSDQMLEARIRFSLRMSRGTAALTTLCCCCLVSQLCPTLWDPMDYSPPGSSVHEVSQVRTLHWVVISFSRGSSQPRDQTHTSCIGRQILYHWVTREALPISWFQPKFQNSGF